MAAVAQKDRNREMEESHTINEQFRLHFKAVRARLKNTVF